MEAISKFIPSFLKKKGIKFLKTVFKKSLVFMTVFAVVFLSLGSLILTVPSAKAASTIVVSTTGLINVSPGAPIGASSAPQAIARISVTTNQTGKALNAATINFSGTGFAASDLLALATDGASGVALYNDAGSGNADNFGAGDLPITLNSPTWSGTNVTLTPATPVNLTQNVASIFYVVIKTSGTIGNGDIIIATIPANGVVTDDTNGPGTDFPANSLVADTVPTVASATAYTDRIIVNFSENVDGMQASNCANYTVNGSVLACAGPGTPFIDFQGNKATIRGLSLSTSATLVIAGSVINDIDGPQNALAAYSSGSLTVNTLTLPAITNINPTSGAVGSSVTIAGANFGNGPAGDNYKVFFSGGFNQNTGPLPPIEVTSFTSWSATSIVVAVPVGAQGGPVNVMVSGVMSDMGSYSFFDIAGSYTAKVYYSADNATPMPDGDNANIRIVTASMSGLVVHKVGDGTMTYASGAPGTFTVTGVSSMGGVWAFDATGAHLNSSGGPINISATQNLRLLATTRKIYGTLTMGATCVAGGQNKSLVVFAMPDAVDSGASGFKEMEPAVFVTGPANGQTECQTAYSIGVPINGTYRVEAHIPPESSGGLTISSAFTDPSSQLVTITDAAQTAADKNFTFSAATHKIMGHVQKPAGVFGAEERNMLWAFAYQPQEDGKGTGTQIDASENFTVYVTPGVWKVGIGGPNMPSSVEVQVDVDSTYALPPGSYTAATKTIVIAPPSDFIEGYAKDAAGNGLANTSIYAWREGGPGGGNANTDSQGYYRMYVTPGSGYHVGAQSQAYGFLGEQTGITVTTSSHPTVNFTVSSANNYTISGTITKGGVGLQQAFVFVTEGERGQMTGGGGTDSSGAYSIKVSGGTNRYLHVGLPGKGEIYTENLGTVGANIGNKDVAINSSTIIVKISPASAVSQAFVGAHSDQGGGFSNTDVSTDVSYKQYNIEVPWPASGTRTYYVEGGVPGYGPLTQASVGVTSAGAFIETSGTANDGTIEYTLSDLYTVSGTVTGTNVTDAWVWASGPNGGGGGSVSSGTYSIKLRNGTYDIGVGKPGYIGNKITTTVSGANVPLQNLTLTTATNTITGKVYLPDGVTTVTNAWVWAENGSGGWAGGSTDASGNYTLSVGSGSWTVKAAYDGYNSTGTSVTAPASGKNITLITVSGFTPNTKNSPITPSDGGIVSGTGIKVDFPKNALGTGTSAGTVEVKSTTNVVLKNDRQLIGTAKEITARNNSNQNVTTLSGSITIELTVSKAELVTANLTFAQMQAIKITYFDSTAGSWVEIPTIVTLSVPSATTIAGLNDDPAITLTGTTTHLSTYAPSIPTDADAPPTPTGLSATAGNVSALLLWAASAGATKYDIYKKIGDDYPYLAQATSTSYTATGLTNGTAYLFKVSALDGSDRESAATSAVSVTPAAPSLNFSVNTSVALTSPSTTATILSGSTADSVTVNAGTLDVTMSSNQTFTLRSTGRKTLSHNSSTLKVDTTCSDSYSQMVVTDSNTDSSVFRITVSDTTCSTTTGGNTGGSSGGTTTTTTTTTTPTTTTPTTTTPTTTTTTPTTSAVSYPDGTLLKSTTDPKVYVVQNGEKVWIETAAKFNAAGYKWTEVKTVSAEIIKQVGVVTLLRAEGDHRVYVVKNSVKRHIASPAEFNTAGYKWSDIQVVAKSQVDAYSETTAVTVKVVNTPTLRVRSANSTSGVIMGKVSRNETFTILEEKNNWYKVKTNTGTIGWISGSYAVKQ